MATPRGAPQVKSKHDKDLATPEKFFLRLKGFDPNAVCAKVDAPKREKVVEKKKKGKGEDLSALLSEGLTVSKKKK